MRIHNWIITLLKSNMSTIVWLIHPSLTTIYGKLDQCCHFTQIFYTHYDSCCVSLLLRFVFPKIEPKIIQHIIREQTYETNHLIFWDNLPMFIFCFLWRATGRVCAKGRMPNGAPERALAAPPRRAWVWRSPAPWDASQDCCGNLATRARLRARRNGVRCPGLRKK